jgi:hypothetical protein
LDHSGVRSKTRNFGWIRSVLDPGPIAIYETTLCKFVNLRPLTSPAKNARAKLHAAVLSLILSHTRALSYAAPFKCTLPLSPAIDSEELDLTGADDIACVKVLVNVWRILLEGVSGCATVTNVYNVMFKS